MAYKSKYHVTHKVSINGTTVSYRIELLKKGYTGESTAKKAMGKIFEFGYDGSDVKKIWDNPVQKGFLELELLIEDSSDIAILNDIFTSDDKEYQLRIKQDGIVKWTGFVISDLIEYREGSFPFGATITAKDLHLLAPENYSTNSSISYKKYAPCIADILNVTGLDLGLNIYDDWTTSQLDSTDDYFNQAYIDEFQLQNFTSYSEGSFESIDYLKALKEIIPQGFVLRQWDNSWQLFDLSHLAKDSGIVTRYEYDAAGLKIGKTTGVDITTDVDRITNFLLESSVNKPFPALRKLEIEYNHKTSIQNILFENQYTHNSSGENSTETIAVADTTQRVVKIGGSVEVDASGSGTFRTGEATLLIQVGDEELSLADGSWDVNNGAATVSVAGSGDTLTGSFFRTSADIPNTIDEDELKVVLRWASVDGETVSEVRWKNLSCELINGEQVDNDASYSYRLTQSGNLTVQTDLEKIIFGQGPNTYSNSALRYWSDGAQYLELSDFSHIGDSGAGYVEFLLTNIMNLQRVHTKNLDADLLSIYEPSNIITYKGDNYFFLNGSLSGKDSRWNGTLVHLEWNESGSDKFEKYFTISDSDSGATLPSSGGGSGGDVEVDWVDVNLKPFSTVETSTGQLDISAGTLSLPQNLGSTSSPEFSGLTLSGLTSDRLISTNGSDTLVSASLHNWLSGTTNQLSVSDNGDGSATISLPQDIHTGASVRFNDITIDDQSLLKGNVYLENNHITLNRNGSDTEAESGGIIIERNDEFSADASLIFDSSSYSSWKLGYSGQEKPVAVTEGSPTDKSILFYDSPNNQFKTDNGLIFDSGVLSGISYTADFDVYQVRSTVTTPQFESGMLGSGFAITSDNNRWTGVFDDLTIRGQLKSYEFMINRVRTTNGSLWVTSRANVGTSESTEILTDWVSTDHNWGDTHDIYDGENIYRIYVDEDIFVPFTEGALIKAQQYTGSGVHLVEGEVINVENGNTTDVEDNSTARYFEIGIRSGSDIPEAGMVFVRFGHKTNTDLQGSIYLSSDDNGAPFLDVVGGVNDFNQLDSKVKLRLGRLDGIIDTDFPTLDGTQQNLYGLWSENAFLKGVFNISANSTGIANFTDGGNLATQDEADWSTQITGSAKPADNADVTSDQFTDPLAEVEEGSTYARLGLDSGGNVKRILSGANLVDGSLNASGLYMTGTNLGYYNSTSDKWTAYIENEGSFFFRDANDDGISFDAGVSNFTISAQNFTLTAGTNDLLVDSTNKIIALQNSTFGETGIQLDYNGGTPRAFVGVKGGNQIKFDGTNVNIVGTVTFTGGSGLDNVDGVGDFAFKSSAGLTDLDSTVISGGKIATDLVVAESIDVTNLSSVNSNTGNLTVSGRIQSSNYSAGSSGYRIRSDGSVEFNNGTFRGTLSGASGDFSGTITATGGELGSLDVTGGLDVGAGGAITWGAGLVDGNGISINAGDNLGNSVTWKDGSTTIARLSSTTGTGENRFHITSTGATATRLSLNATQIGLIGTSYIRSTVKSIDDDNIFRVSGKSRYYVTNASSASFANNEIREIRFTAENIMDDGAILILEPRFNSILIREMNNIRTGLGDITLGDANNQETEIAMFMYSGYKDVWKLINRNV